MHVLRPISRPDFTKPTFHEIPPILTDFLGINSLTLTHLGESR